MKITKLILKHNKQLIGLLSTAYPNLCRDCKSKIAHQQLNDLNKYCDKCQIIMQPYFEEFKKIIQ